MENIINTPVIKAKNYELRIVLEGLVPKLLVESMIIFGTPKSMFIDHSGEKPLLIAIYQTELMEEMVTNYIVDHLPVTEL